MVLGQPSLKFPIVNVLRSRSAIVPSAIFGDVTAPFLSWRVPTLLAATAAHAVPPNTMNRQSVETTFA
jgi:hypothetical protein